jgi:hypothetical protein
MLQVEKELLLETLRLHGKCEVRVGGFCMRPVIRNNARVVLQAVREEDLVPGDIVGYFTNAKFFVHRIIRKSAGKLIMRGDSPWSAAHAIEPVTVAGRVISIRNQSFFARILERIRVSYA